MNYQPFADSFNDGYRNASGFRSDGFHDDFLTWEEWRKQEDSLHKKMKKWPLTSVAIGVGVGLVAGPAIVHGISWIVKKAETKKEVK